MSVRLRPRSWVHQIQLASTDWRVTVSASRTWRGLEGCCPLLMRRQGPKHRSRFHRLGKRPRPARTDRYLGRAQVAQKPSRLPHPQGRYRARRSPDCNTLRRALRRRCLFQPRDRRTNARQLSPRVRSLRVKPQRPRPLRQSRSVPGSSEMSNAKVAGLPPAGLSEPEKPASGNADPSRNSPKIQAQVTAATAVALQVTAAELSEPDASPADAPAAGETADHAEGSDPGESVVSAQGSDGAAALPIRTEGLVALILVRSEVTSVSDLSDKTVAIDDGQSASKSDVRVAIVAAGGAGVATDRRPDQGDRPAHQRSGAGGGAGAGVSRRGGGISRDRGVQGVSSSAVAGFAESGNDDAVRP